MPVAVGAVVEVLPHGVALVGAQLAVEAGLDRAPPACVRRGRHGSATRSGKERLPEGRSFYGGGKGRCLPAGSRCVVEVVTDVDARNRELYQRCVLPEVEVLLRVARGMTGQSADAEDLVQDTLLRAWRSIATFDGQHPRAWLLTIMRNAHVNRSRRQRPVLLDDPEVTFERHRGTTDDVPSAEDLVVDQTFDAAVETAVAGLSEQFREVLVLVDVQGLSYAAAAQVLGVPEGTVMSRLHRARKRVRAHLEKAGVVSRRRS